jgi:rsbT co-antagonist protein RsbR
MTANDQVGPGLSPVEKAAMKDLWEITQRYEKQMRDELIRECEKIPSMAELMKRMTPEQMEDQNKASRVLTRAAFLEEDWAPLTAQQRQQGAMYASMGIPFADWFEVVSAYQKAIIPLMVKDYVKEPERLAAVLIANNKYLDYAMGVIGDEYLKTKERIIGQQQEAIQELSTPVLQIRDQLLLVPLVGVLDTSRARLLTQQLLSGIRAHRARVVVIDITGVAAVDSKVANHIFQTVAAVKLMGARTIITGLSSDVAEALVALGVDVDRLDTVSDLQGGIEEANRILGVKLVKAES